MTAQPPVEERRSGCVPDPITGPLKADSADDGASQRDPRHKGDLTSKKFRSTETEGAARKDLRVALESQKQPLADSQQETRDDRPSTARNSAGDGHSLGADSLPRLLKGSPDRPTP